MKNNCCTMTVLSAFILLLTGCQEAGLHKETRVMMGTFVEVVSPEKAAPQIAFEEIKRIEKLVSKYDPNSEIFTLNHTGKIQAGPETFYLIKKSKEFWEMSEGGFDPTVGPLVDLWGFTDKNFRVPAPEEIKTTLGNVGMDKVILNEKSQIIEFKNKNMKIDLGAIAKGYAVDCAVQKLKAAGVKSCLINAGGQIYCLGDKFGKPWKVSIKNPYSRNQNSQNQMKPLELKDRAVSTSGNYEQFFMKGNKRYSHIFNPKTGYPVDNRIFSVTVVASDGLTADALSTAAFVLGSEKSWEMQKKFPDVRMIILEMEPDK